ncbi:FGGY-family carbohydrate kinase [Dyadobacter fermentans]|uniref:Carbohydrate kinase FGGY n=1 Tax=Dyadobacter fermentans (strain ATCC 700827 / DSM 18053 / CIP 107007 / KCTC 52180 / NS114) TaxID=471854 RepID=C6W6K6_DYAFD|nr:FGGY-family carbohydrate kinase [Dyadobacter fermentans]ACT94346.1 carbohydrate kinase FGGY [Dyadobacter fermentans DSM 18053]
MQAYFIGIDVGTQGVRVVMLDNTGSTIGSSEQIFPLTPGSREEQSPAVWWEAVWECLQKLLHAARGNIDLNAVKAVSVTSTSGTVIPLGDNHEPLHKALMYSDTRPAEEGKHCRELALRYHAEGYTGFNASSGLSKMVWYSKHYPENAARIKTWVHAADFIIGKLCGDYSVTDFTNALKSGFDVGSGEWPSWLTEHLPLHKDWFQKVVPSGTTIGNLLPDLRESLGLGPIRVIAGMTDGCASQVASGAVQPGDWNTTIGTTLVVKGVTIREVRDPEGRLYSHRHPEGYWMPGGAGNIGADWVSAGFADDLAALNTAAASLIPTGLIAYPLLQAGERFPFIAPQARGFAPADASREATFAANMEGVAFVERYAYEMIEKLSREVVKAVYTAGGGSNSDVWLRIRANVLNRPVHKCGNVTGAAGAAIVAAAGSHFGTLSEAARAMTRIESTVYPEPALAEAYRQQYRNFIQTLTEKGFIAGPVPVTH